MEEGINKLKKAWNDNPMQVIIVASLAATAASKLMNSTTSARNAKAWKKEVDRRAMMTTRK